MKNIKINIYAVLMLLTVTSSCQNKTKNTMLDKEQKVPEFEWVENLNCPLGYPIAVYRGSIGTAGLSDNFISGKRGWGSYGSGSSNDVKALPKGINCIWVSYAENCMYSIDCAIDYDKMVHLFQEGYQDSLSFFNGDGEYKKTTFDTVLVGLAPGGVVVIWVFGAGRTVEIGRYKGEKFIVPQAEIDQLDNHERLWFDEEDRKNIMLDTNIVPLPVRKAHAGKPIPYGLWDTYRTRYTWRPTYLLTQKEGIVDGIDIECFNGETEELFDKTLTENKYQKRAIPRNLSIGWKDKKGQKYGGYLKFDEVEIFKAFEEIYKDDKEGKADLQFSINYTNDYVTVVLKKGDKEIRLPKTKIVEIFETDAN